MLTELWWWCGNNEHVGVCVDWGEQTQWKMLMIQNYKSDAAVFWCVTTSPRAVLSPRNCNFSHSKARFHWNDDGILNISAQICY